MMTSPRSVLTTLVVLVLWTSCLVAVGSVDGSWKGTGPRSPDEGAWSGNHTIANMGQGTISPSVTVADGTIHCAFVHDGVYYSKSTDNGANWKNPVQVSSPGTTGALSPSIAAEGSDVYIIWNQDTGGTTTHKMYLTKSNDSGDSFVPPQVLTGQSGHWSTDGRIVVQDGTLYVAWADDRDDPTRANQEVYFKRSADKGDTWTVDKRLTTANWPSFHTHLGVSGDTVHIVWEDERLGGTHRTYYKRSNDGGDTWTSDSMISAAGIDVVEPGLAVEGSTLHVVWSRQPFVIEYRRSTNGGISWETIKSIGSGGGNHRHEPLIDAKGDFVEVVWNQAGDMVLKNSTNAGSTFSQDQVLGSDLNLVNYEGAYQPIEIDDNGSYLVYSYDGREIRFRYKGPLPDMAVSSSDIMFSDPYGHEGGTYVNITVTARNQGLRDVLNATLEIYLDMTHPIALLTEIPLGAVPKGGYIETVYEYEVTQKESDIHVIINDTVPFEGVLDNNRASKHLSVPHFLPSASLNIDKDHALTYENITFDASGSTAPEGTIEGYLFDFGDGEDTGWTLGPIVTHQYVDDGCYTARVKVKNDGDDESGWASKAIVIDNRRPTARIEITTSESERVSLVDIHLSAEGSSDMDGDIVEYSWDLDDGLDPTGPLVSGSYPTPGQRTIRLMVRDDDNSTHETSIILDIGNLAPVAIARTADDELVYHKGESVDVDGSGSYDPDGEITSAEWDLGDGSSKRGLTASHRYNKAGNYTIVLTVTDDLGAKTSTNLSVHVFSDPPTLDIGANETIVMTFEPVKFTSGASDVDGAIVGYSWDLGDGNTSISPDPEHLYTNDGTYLVTLTVTDDDGETAEGSLTIRVRNRDPTAFARANNTYVYTGEEIAFSGSESNDKDGTITGFDWRFGDASKGNGENITHVYAVAGTYKVTLEVVDDDGARASYDIEIVVEDRPPDDRPEVHDGGLSPSVMAAIAIGVAVLVLVIALIVRKVMTDRGSQKGNDEEGSEEEGSSDQAPEDGEGSSKDHDDR